MGIFSIDSENRKKGEAMAERISLLPPKDQIEVLQALKERVLLSLDLSMEEIKNI